MNQSNVTFPFFEVRALVSEGLYRCSLNAAGLPTRQRSEQEAAIKIGAYQLQASNLPNQFDPKPSSARCQSTAPRENRNYPFMSI